MTRLLPALLLLLSGCASVPTPETPVPTDPRGAVEPVVAAPPPPEDLTPRLDAAVTPGVPAPVFPDASVRRPLWLVSGVRLSPLVPLPELPQGAMRTFSQDPLGSATPGAPAYDASLAPDPGPPTATPPSQASPAARRPAPPRTCPGAASVPEGFAGSPPLAPHEVVPYVVQTGDSWWLYARRHALSYSDLARLNGLALSTVRAGRGLVAGTTVHLVMRAGPARAGRLPFCGDDPAGADARYRIFPDGALWRAPFPDVLAGAMATAPALHDPSARWVSKPHSLTLSGWATSAGAEVDALLCYNGLSPGSVASGVRPRAHWALPAKGAALPSC